MLFTILILSICIITKSFTNSYVSKLFLQKFIRRHHSSFTMVKDDVTYAGPDSTPILDSINSPKDLKKLDLKQLKQLSYELRWGK